MASAPTQSVADDTPHLQFVQEYARELAEQENIRIAAEPELKAPNADPIMSGLHWNSRVRLALASDIAVMSATHLSAPLEELPGQIVSFYKQKSEIHGQMIEISTTMLSGPKPGVDLGQVVAKMPQLRAMLESADEAFIKLSVLVCMSLLDMKPDAAGHVSHLIITAQQRAALLKQLKTEFGAKLNAKGQSALVSAAGVIQDFLLKGYKNSDDPW